MILHLIRILAYGLGCTIEWLDAFQEGWKEGYEEKQKELEAVAKYVVSLFLGFMT
jgi:hypothetical protein